MACFIRNSQQHDKINLQARLILCLDDPHVLLFLYLQKCADFDFEQRRKRRNTVKLSRDKCTPT